MTENSSYFLPGLVEQVVMFVGGGGGETVVSV
jgi:hypothetical protein